MNKTEFQNTKIELPIENLALPPGHRKSSSSVHMPHPQWGLPSSAILMSTKHGL